MPQLNPAAGRGRERPYVLECLPTIRWRLQLWDVASSWRQRLLFPIDGPIADSSPRLDMAANKNAAPYAVDTWPLLQHAR